MNFSMRLRTSGDRFEVFSFGIFTNKLRLIPSFYRFPFWSLRFLWLTLTLSFCERLLDENNYIYVKCAHCGTMLRFEE